MKKYVSGNLFLIAIPLLFSCCRLEKKAGEVEPPGMFHDCPAEGSAKTENLSALNRLKNRTITPTLNDFDKTITFKKLLEPGNDRERWSSLKAVKITGYVYDIKTGGVETCNCKEKEIDNRDAHIEILSDPMNDGKILRMIVEVTPRMRALMKEKGVNWSTSALRDKLLGRWVNFEGWLLFDAEHASQAENTNPGRERNWRATAWEIHPVTSIEVVTKPK